MVVLVRTLYFNPRRDRQPGRESFDQITHPVGGVRWFFLRVNA